MAGRHKLLRLLRQYSPSILAVDNIFELAKDRKELIDFMARLPGHTKLVQVTGGDKPESLVRIAGRYGLSFDRLDPNAESLTCARLAGLGVGAEVSAFEERTVIKVSRGRSPGKGGWSQNRYRRKVHGAVREKAREIEQMLKEQSASGGIEYVMDCTEAFGGCSKCEFTVEAPRKSLHVHSGRHGDVQVSVSEIERDSIAFIPLARRGHTIVGIDPGTTTAVAVLSLSGELIWLHSSRTESLSDLIDDIAEKGKPLIIASDVYPTPNAVEKIRRAFNAVLGSPSVLLTSRDKTGLAEGFEYANSHERDALAAAVSVFRKHRNKFEQIRKKVPPGIDAEDIIASVIRGESVESAVESVAGRATAQDVKPVPEPPKESAGDETAKLRETLHRQAEQIESMRGYIDELRSEIQEKKSTIARLESHISHIKKGIYRELRHDQELRHREKEIAHIRKELKGSQERAANLALRIERLKSIRRLEVSGKGVPVKIVATFTKESIQRTIEQYGIKKGDVVLLEDASGGGGGTAGLLASLGVRAVVITGEMSHAAEETLFREGVPVFGRDELHVQSADDFAVANPDDLGRALERWRRLYEERKKAAKEEWLETLIAEYRSERAKGKI
ncbi:MAG TPA: DUF460 domain-containing protein [Candidatus Methanoperedenaceae archaeon]|nr:DUF460 domain-containing protein [Candidatus Methanoperedenaceae archaeon]